MKIIPIFKCITIFICFTLIFGCATYRINQGAEAYRRGDYDEAAKQWNPCAKDGNYYAQYNLGILFEQGLGNTPLNPDQALAWYMLSAKQGYFPAMVRLASLQRSKGYDAAAESWLVLAARWGHQDAVNTLREWGKEVPAADLLAQQQYNNAVANQKIIDAVLLSFIAVLNGAVEYHNATHYQSPPVSYQPSIQVPSSRISNKTPGYQTKDSFGNIVNSNSNYQTKDNFGNLVNSNSNYQSKDHLGNVVNSTSCYQTKDLFGNIVKSAGCAK